MRGAVKFPWNLWKKLDRPRIWRGQRGTVVGWPSSGLACVYVKDYLEVLTRNEKEALHSVLGYTGKQRLLQPVSYHTPWHTNSWRRVN